MTFKKLHFFVNHSNNDFVLQNFNILLKARSVFNVFTCGVWKNDLRLKKKQLY